MRLVAWNCSMALHRKFDALMTLRPDLAVVSECAHPDRLCELMGKGVSQYRPVWIGSNPNKGLGVFAFNGYKVRPLRGYDKSLRHILPVKVTGPMDFHLLAVWAQNFSDNIRRKDQPGPFRLALDRYRHFLRAAPSVVAGDLNNNVFWDKPGWPINQAAAVTSLRRRGLVSAYHAVTGEVQGQERQPTHYWRDRKKDGPTYHIDYIFLPKFWLPDLSEMTVGSFEDWCGNGLSDHVPLTIEVSRRP